jgi:serine/threonine protein kinase
MQSENSFGVTLSGQLTRDYEILQLLGRGGMGEVYLAEQVRVGRRRVALKVLNRGYSKDPDIVKRFENEAALAGRINHPNVIMVFESRATDDGQLYVAMEYVEGASLGNILAERGALPINEIVEIIRQVGAGMMAAHNLGIVHRDIKPDNIMLTYDANGVLLAKVIDFGIARLSEAGALAAKTQAGMILGTPYYMSPEQADGQTGDQIDCRADIYALGMMMYEMLTGRVAFASNSWREVLHKHINETPVAPSKIRPELQGFEGLESLVMKALAKKRNDRQQTVRQFIEELEATLPGRQPPLPEIIPDPGDPIAFVPPIRVVPTDALHHVRYDPEEQRAILLAILDDFFASVNSSDVRALLGRKWIEDLYEQKHLIEERLSSPFSLVVLGEFKRGKSTLINALLRFQVVTTDVTPETITINEITYGRQLQAHVRLKDGGKAELNLGDLKSENLAEILADLPTPASHLEIQAPAEWLKGVQLVDTPGMGDLFRRFDQQVLSYLPRADAVIYVMSAVAALAETEREFLRLSLRPQEFRKVFFVVNQLDNLRTEADSRRVMEAISKRVKLLFPLSPVFGVSALDEISQAQGKTRLDTERASALAKGFEELRSSLQETIFLNRDAVQLDRILAQVENLLNHFENVLNRLKEALAADHQRLAQALAQCEDQTSELHSQFAEQQRLVGQKMEVLSVQACGWMDEFLARFEDEALAEVRHSPIAELKQHFSFFLADSLCSAMHSILDAHRAEIFDVVGSAHQAIVADINRLTDIGDAPSEIARVVAEANFTDSLWSDFDTLNLLMDGMQTEISGFAARLLAGGGVDIAEQLAGRSTPAGEYQQQLIASLHSLHSLLLQKIQSLYAKMVSDLLKEIEKGYHHELESLAEAIRQAQSLLLATEQQGAEIGQTINDVLASCTRARSSALHLRRKLWPDEAGLR